MKIVSVHNWLSINIWTLKDKQYKRLLIFIWRDSLREQRSPSMRHDEAYLCPPLPVVAGLKCQQMLPLNLMQYHTIDCISSQKSQRFPPYYNRLEHWLLQSICTWIPPELVGWLLLFLLSVVLLPALPVSAVYRCPPVVDQSAFYSSPTPVRLLLSVLLAPVPHIPTKRTPIPSVTAWAYLADPVHVWGGRKEDMKLCWSVSSIMGIWAMLDAASIVWHFPNIADATLGRYLLLADLKSKCSCRLVCICYTIQFWEHPRKRVANKGWHEASIFTTQGYAALIVTLRIVILINPPFQRRGSGGTGWQGSEMAAKLLLFGLLIGLYHFSWVISLLIGLFHFS